jgi:proliferating cell nuclear antigen PCNA
MNITINNTGNAERFGLLFQHIRLFTEHVNVTFDKDKMFMQSMDSSRISVFELSLPSTWFDSYEHTGAAPITLGIHATMLFKILNTRDKSQNTQIIYNEEDDKLFINFASINTSVFNKRFELPLMDLDCDIMAIPTTESAAEFSIDSAIFSNLINQLKIFGDTIEIECTEDKITLHSISIEAGKMVVDINIDDLTEYSINEGEVMKLSFSLTMLHNICMYNKIAKEVEIHLTNDFPMKIKYLLGDDGGDASFTFYLAPKIGDDD